MNQQEWLKGLKPGDRVRSVSDDPLDGRIDGGDWGGTVVHVDDDEVVVYDDGSGETERYPVSGEPIEIHLCNGKWNIEPLSEWRKEPPDEEGWWWCFSSHGPEPFLKELFAIFVSHEHDEWGYWTPDGYDTRLPKGDLWWQKANVPEPPEG